MKEKWNKSVCLGICMIVVLMGIQMIPGTEAKRPRNSVPYQGPYAISLDPGWNLVTPMCQPYTENGLPFTAKLIWEKALWEGGTFPHYDWIIQCVKYRTPTDELIWFIPPNEGTNFLIVGGTSYWIEVQWHTCRIPMSSGIDSPSYCPKHQDIYLHGADEPGYTGYNYVGHMWAFTPVIGPPVPPTTPPPPPNWYYYLTWFGPSIKNIDGITPCTYDYQIYQFNSYTQEYEVYDAWYGGTWAHHSNVYGCGNIHWGFIIYMPTGGWWEIVNP